MEAVVIGEKMTQVLLACTGDPTTLHHGTVLRPVDVFDPREGRRACKTTSVPMQT